MTDLKFNYPSMTDEGQFIKRYVQECADEVVQALPFPSIQGIAKCLATVRNWLNISSETDVTICNSGNHAINCTLEILRSIATDIMTDAFTYPAFKQCALKKGFKLHATPSDKYGLTLAGIEDVYKKTKAKILYLQPTIHNPTCSVMPLERREQIAEFARQKGLLLIEDDAYRFLHSTPPSSFLELIPTQTFHLYSLSKPFNPLLKVTYVILPKKWVSEFVECVRLTSSGSSSLLMLMADYFIRSGILDAIIHQKRNNVSAIRQRIMPLLEGLTYTTHSESYHIWINLPDQANSSLLVKRLAEDEIIVPSGSDFAVGDQHDGEKYLRVALAAEKDLDKLEKAILKVRNAILSS